MKLTRSTANALSLGLALGATALAGCSGGGGSSGTRLPVNTPHSTAAVSPAQIAERFLAYLADEATTGAGGTDLNGDGDLVDSVAAVQDMAANTTRVVGVSADDIALLRTVANGTHLFTVTDENKDQTDWNGDLDTNDLVLLHTQLETASAVTFVDEVDNTGPCRIVTTGGRLYYGEAAPALVAPETSILYVDTAAPTAPVRVTSAVLGDALVLQLLGEDQGMIFLTQDETITGVDDFNADGDFLDADVLALLDGTNPAGAVFQLGLALRDDNVPVRAQNVGANDWIVAFLVDEANQGATNLNDPALFAASWQPPQCLGFEDADALDQVLHYLQFAQYTANPVNSPVRNTGLVGDDRILAVWDGANASYVATISLEADEGTCDLNGDADTLDEMLRWVEVTMPVTAVTPVLPFTNSNELLAAAPVAGGTQGALEFDDRFVGVISEADDGRDHDGDPLTDNDLIAWLDPFLMGAATWTFDHTTPPPPPINAVGTGWMAQRPEGDVIPVAFPEVFSAGGGDINGDGDTLDSVPTWASFDGGGTELDFPGVPVAVAATNAGIDVSNGLVFYRVDEAADSRDWNGDGDMLDMVLFRTTAATGQNSFFVGTLNNLVGPAIFRADPANGVVGIAFVSDETMETGADFNGDGDSNDLVLRTFRVN